MCYISIFKNGGFIMIELNLEDITKAKSKVSIVSYSIDKEVLEDFKRISKAKKYNRSKIIERFLKQFIKAEQSLV
jgi:hypothetical protein